MDNTLDENLVQKVKDSYGRCLKDGNLIETFYNFFLNSSEEVAAKFADTDFEQQYKLLKHGLNLMILYANQNVVGKAGLTRIQETHNRYHMNIEPYFYDLWRESLIKAVEKHDTKFDEEVKIAWQKLVSFGSDYIIAGY
ncbi:globin [Fulvivirga sediminis]|uniref:Globin n=1 Tax=Fulvivirga sediminis TaxID=2803949 RepID=A0A937F573_9BACT|nr:globin [Fulvivirga sediminis]MBL3655231.1 globin [Fulvivirga sediminis]